MDAPSTAASCEIAMTIKTVSLLVFVAIALLALCPDHAWASGVGVSPKELHFDAHDSGFTHTLYVINTGDAESSYKVYAEGEYGSWFEISPNEFRLAPNELIVLEISLSPPPGVSGKHIANICVVSFESLSRLQIGAGIKVPAYIDIEALPVSIPMVIALAVVFLAVLIGIGIFWRRKRATEVL